MNPKDKENVIAFYKSRVYMSGMPKAESLTDKELEIYKDTTMFAIYMLSVNYNECVNVMKETLKRILLK